MCGVCAQGYVRSADDMNILLFCMTQQGIIGTYRGKFRVRKSWKDGKKDMGSS